MQLQKTYWIRFNKDTGNIISITKRKPNVKDDEGFFESSKSVCGNIVRGKENIKNYKVHWDLLNDIYDIDKKKSELNLQPVANKLEEIKSHTEDLTSDVHIDMYINSQKAVVSVNVNKIKKTANLSRINSIVENEFSLMNIFICDKQDPDKLLCTIEVDTYLLFKNKKVVFDLPNNITNAKSISLYTLPLFENYTISYRDDVFDDVRSVSNRYINYNNNEKNSQINIYALNDRKLKIQSSIKGKDYSLFDSRTEFTMLVCDGNYDSFIGGLTLQVSDLIDKDTLEIDLPFSIGNKPMFLYKGNSISLSYNGVKK